MHSRSVYVRGAYHKNTSDDCTPTFDDVLAMKLVEHTLCMSVSTIVRAWADDTWFKEDANRSSITQQVGRGNVKSCYTRDSNRQSVVCKTMANVPRFACAILLHLFSIHVFFHFFLSVCIKYRYMDIYTYKERGRGGPLSVHLFRGRMPSALSIRRVARMNGTESIAFSRVSLSYLLCSSNRK